MTTIKDRFAGNTATAVQERLQKEFSADVDLRQGSLVGDLTRGNAEEFAYAYKMLDFVLKSVILSPDMPSDMLTLKAQEYGLKRYDANPAKAVVTFTGDEGTAIPVGTEVRTSREPIVRFKTLANTTVGAEGTATVEVIAQEGGANTNVAATRIDTVVGDLAGVLSVTNEEAAKGGYDTQSDEELYEQILAVIQRPITSGNVYHYEKWATDVEGIRKAKVYPLWAGNGTVKVVLLASNGTSPSEEKVKETAAYIEKERPIGATVTVVGAKEVPINVNATLVLAEGADIEAVTEEYTQLLTIIFADTAFKTSIVRYSRMAALALDTTGVVDWTELTVNGGTSNIELADDEIAVVGEVTFNVASKD